MTPLCAARPGSAIFRRRSYPARASPGTLLARQINSPLPGKIPSPLRKFWIFFRKTHAAGFPGTNNQLKPIKYYALDYPRHPSRPLGPWLRLWYRRRHHSPDPSDRTDRIDHAVGYWPPSSVTGITPVIKRGGHHKSCGIDLRALNGNLCPAPPERLVPHFGKRRKAGWQSSHLGRKHTGLRLSKHTPA